MEVPLAASWRMTPLVCSTRPFSHGECLWQRKTCSAGNTFSKRANSAPWTEVNEANSARVSERRLHQPATAQLIATTLHRGRNVFQSLNNQELIEVSPPHLQLSLTRRLSHFAMETKFFI